MLIEKSIKLNDVITIKLTTGEELIARYQGEESSSLNITKPIVLAAGAQGIGMVPWLMSGLPDTISINKDIVITHCSTQKEIADQYIQATTDIKLA